MHDGRKYPEQIENPIDNILIKSIRLFYKYFRLINLTPNFFTTLSLIFGLLTVYNIYNQSYLYSAVFYFFSYICDVIDGNYARTFNLVTIFGDYYDHISDLVINILILITYLNYGKLKLGSFMWFIIIFLCLTQSISLGCMEKYVRRTSYKHKSHSFNNLTNLCPDIIEKNYLEYLKYFSCGTYIILIISILILNHYYS